MKKVVCLMITLFIVLSFKGQSIKVDPDKVYTLNPITKSKFITNEDNKIKNIKIDFINENVAIDNTMFKITPYDPSYSETILGEACYWLVVALAIL